VPSEAGTSAKAARASAASFEAAQALRDEGSSSRGLTKDLPLEAGPSLAADFRMVSGAWVRLAQPPTGGHWPH